jgi:hypothetical protein
VFGNRVLIGTFSPKETGIEMEWRKLHEEERRDIRASSKMSVMIESKI